MKLEGLKKIPMWVWGLIIGSLAVVWMWSSRSVDSGGADGDDEGASSDTATISVPQLSNVGVLGSNDYTGYLGGTPSSTTDGGTNQQWLSQAVTAVVNKRNASVVSVQGALQKYLYGEALSNTESGYVNDAIGLVGMPPEGVAGITELAGPTPEEQKAMDAQKAAEAAAAAAQKAAAQAIKDADAQTAAARKRAAEEAQAAADEAARRVREIQIAADKQSAEAAKQSAAAAAAKAAADAVKKAAEAAATKTHTVQSSGGTTFAKIGKVYGKTSNLYIQQMYVLNALPLKKRLGKTISTKTVIPKGTPVLIPKAWKKV
jgi:hypothetical protein